MNIPLGAILGIVFFASERLLAWRRHSSKVEAGQAADRGTLRMLWRVALLSIVAGLLVSHRPIGPIGPHLPARWPWPTTIITLFGLGTGLRWWAITYLGRFFTVDIAVLPDHRVIDRGPYRYVRHPSYTGLLMQYLGLALSFNSVVAVPVVLVPIFISLLLRIRAEEAALTQAFDGDYTAYCRRTKRLLPLIY